MKNGFNFIVDLLPTRIGSLTLDTRACCALAVTLKLNEECSLEEKIRYACERLFSMSYEASLENSGLTEEEFNRQVEAYLSGATPVKSWKELHSDSKQEKTTSYRKPDFDFVQDSGSIVSAFRQVYGMSLDEVCETHWWEFLALFNNLPYEGTAFASKIQIRNMKIESNDTPERKQQIREAKKAVELKDTRSPSQKKADFQKQVDSLEL